MSQLEVALKARNFLKHVTVRGCMFYFHVNLESFESPASMI